MLGRTFRNALSADGGMDTAACVETHGCFP